MSIVIDSSLFLYGDEVFDQFTNADVITGLDSLADGTLLTILSVYSADANQYYQVVVSSTPPPPRRACPTPGTTSAACCWPRARSGCWAWRAWA